MVTRVKTNRVNSIVTTIGVSGTDTNIPTEKAVRDSLNALPGGLTGSESIVDRESFITGESVTAGNSLFPESLPPLELTVSDSPNVTFNATSTNTDFHGFRILSKVNGVIEAIEKTGTTTATIAEIRNDAGTIIATANFVVNTATFSPAVAIVSGTHYRVGVSVPSGNYILHRNNTNPGYPLVRTNVDFVSSAFGVGTSTTLTDSLGVTNVITTPATASPTQAVGDVVGNTRLAVPQFGSGIAGNSVSLPLRVFGAPSDPFSFRIETDNNGEPSGTLFSPNAEGSIAPGSVTGGLQIINIQLSGATQNNAHGVTLDDTQVSQVGYKGVKITLTQQVGVLTVVKDSDCTATHAYIYDTNLIELAKTTFSTNTATFNFNSLINGGTYYVLAGSEGSSYTSVRQTGATAFPYVSNRLDYIQGGLFNIATDTRGPNFTGSGAFGTMAVRFIPNKKCILKSYSASGFTGNAQLREGTTVLETGVGGTFSGNIVLQANVEYNIFYNNGTAQLGFSSSTFTNNNVQIGSATWSVNASPVFIQNTTIITWDLQDNTDLNNITDVTTSDSILIPKGQKVHLVSFVGTYGSETINPTNYYGVGYSRNNSNSRYLSLFDGTNWGALPENVFNDGAFSSIYTATQTNSGEIGVRLTAKQSFILHTVVRHPAANPNRLFIRDAAGAVITTQTIVSNTIVLNTPILIQAGQTFTVSMDSTSGNYTSRRRNTTQTGFTGTFVDVITGGVTQGNVETIGVLTPSSYNSFYADSVLFSSTLLSKTNAFFPYKLPRDVARIAFETKSEGQNCITTTLGLTDKISTVAQGATYYIANNDGGIQTTPGTNIYAIGRGVAAGKLFVEGRSVNVAIPVGTSPFNRTNNTNKAVQVIVSGGTVSAITIAGITVATATNFVGVVAPGQVLVITYTVLPTLRYSEF